MSGGGGGGGGGRNSCCSSVHKSVKKMIETINEIAGNHSDEEIYAMLKECSMDPNEAAQRLLLQDPFHEVRSKREKRKDQQQQLYNNNNNNNNNNNILRGGGGGTTTTNPTRLPHPAARNGRNTNNPPPAAGKQALASSSSSTPAPHPSPSPPPTSSDPPPLLQPTKPKATPSSSNYYHATAQQQQQQQQQQLLVGPHKAVGPGKEWKPKPINPSTEASEMVQTCEFESTTDEETPSLATLSAPLSAESIIKPQQKLKELHLSHNQHVIIPSHLQVPEAERTGLSFGSFDSNFAVKRSYNSDPDTDKSSTPYSESSQEVGEIAEERCPSNNQIESSTIPEGDYSDHHQPPKNVQDNLSSVEADSSSSAVNEYGLPKPETVAPLGVSQYTVHTAPNYSIGLMPPILGTHFATFDTSEPQARDASRLPSFVVQQSFDPTTSYYTHFYRHNSADTDGRFSPLLGPGSANKYTGSIAMLSPQSGQPQESGNSLALSTAGPTPLATQAAGVMQSSVAVAQQPVPVFRQPSGVHLPYYPPNYIPYNQYFPPFYVPQPIHHYLANTAFPQQPLTGSVYSSPAAAATTGVKYPLSQYKPVTSTGNSTHVGIPSGYAPYSSSPSGYSPAANATNSAGNDDLTASEYKENNVYVSGQQSEGSAVWIPAPGREISGLQASAFYSLSPQGQHVTFAPTQASHGAFTGIYHPIQTMTPGTVHPLLQQSQSMGGPLEMVGAPGSAYQQPQRAQMNWTKNY